MAATLVAALFVAILVMVFFLGREIFQNLERQRSANSDNVQWTLTQVEVEYLTYLNALDRTTRGVGTASPDELNEVRLQFDVFYSRVDTLRASPLFSELRETFNYTVPLQKVSNYLQAAIPLIDGSDDLLRSGVPELYALANDLHPSVRALSISGLSYFAVLSDERRAATSRTLVRLAAILVILLLMLTALTVYLASLNRKASARGKALHQANKRIQTVLATSLDAVIVVNLEGRILEFNPTAEAIFGRTHQDVLGKSIGDLIVPQHMRDAHNAAMKRMQEGGERRIVGQGRVQLEALRSDGTIFPVELAIESATLGSEEILIGYVRDISQRVADEKALIDARDKALAGEKAKTDVLTVMSHEIRTPLNGILGNLSLLTNTDLTLDQQKLTHNMEVSGQVLMNHVDTVLDIARFDAGRLNASSEKVNISTLMQEIVDGQSGNAASRGNTIGWQWLGATRHWVITDEQRLRQILLNLVGNAIKFTEDGRVSLEVECTQDATDPTVCEYEFRVIDTGIGISEADQERIFEDFETSDASISRTAGGTGLGLGISRRFVETLGGQIGVESEPGEGSVFWVRLPLEITNPEASMSKEKDTAKLGENLDILVVEDNEINAEVVRRMLVMDDHSVTIAEHGKAGVEAADAHRYDLILMDISMPVMDGPTATKRIRSGDGASKNTPIIAVSANVLPGAIETFRAAGMNAFLGKPLTIETLRRALQAIMSGSDDDDTSEAAVPSNALEQLKEQLGESRVSRLLTTFLDEGDELSNDLVVSDWEAADNNSLGRTAHKLAGSAGILGFDDLRAALLTFETHALQNETEELASAAGRTRAAWAKIRPAVETHIN